MSQIDTFAVVFRCFFNVFHVVFDVLESFFSENGLDGVQALRRRRRRPSSSS